MYWSGSGYVFHRFSAYEIYRQVSIDADTFILSFVVEEKAASLRIGFHYFHCHSSILLVSHRFTLLYYRIDGTYIVT